MLGVVGSIVKIAEGFKDPQEMVVVLERAIEAAKKVKGGSGVTMRLLALCADMHTRNGDEDRCMKWLHFRQMMTRSPIHPFRPLRFGVTRGSYFCAFPLLMREKP
jgi:hypothetical protein